MFLLQETPPPPAASEFWSGYATVWAQSNTSLFALVLSTRLLVCVFSSVTNHIRSVFGKQAK